MTTCWRCDDNDRETSARWRVEKDGRHGEHVADVCGQHLPWAVIIAGAGWRGAVVRDLRDSIDHAS